MAYTFVSGDSIQLAYKREKTVAVEVSNYKEELALTCSSSSEVGFVVAGTDATKTITVTV